MQNSNKLKIFLHLTTLLFVSITLFLPSSDMSDAVQANALKPESPAPPVATLDGDTYIYTIQSGDTLPALAARFEVSPDDIQSEEPLSDTEFLQSGMIVKIPNRVEDEGPAEKLIPDVELIFSMTSLDYDNQSFISNAGGYLNQYNQLIGNGWHTGAEVIYQNGIDYSINPRLLLATLEYQSHWVYGKPITKQEALYPIGFVSSEHEELFSQTGWMAQQFNIGYYGWRAGILTEIGFPDGSRMRLAPDLNAGTVALQYALSLILNQDEWYEALYGNDSIMVLYERMFDSPWDWADEYYEKYGDLIPAGLTQPDLSLPLELGREWNLTGGPHTSWGTAGPWGALDFAPVGVKECAKSMEWALASASGRIVRTDEGPVILDMDGDGFEQTGWNLLYMHIAAQDRILEGTLVEKDDLIGHPSCYGGRSTGTHLHYARKYNGEWMLADMDGPVPLVLSGWVAHNGVAAYKGELVRGSESILASDTGIAETVVIREE